MTTAVRLRRTVATEAALVRLFGAYLSFYEVPRTAPEIDAFLGERLADPQTVLLTAWADDRMIGFSQSYLLPNSLSLGRMAVLNDLFIDPVARGHGYGRHLLVGTTDVLRDLGLDRVELSTAATNCIGQALYESAGWRRDTEFWHYALDLTLSR